MPDASIETVAEEQKNLALLPQLIDYNHILMTYLLDFRKKVLKIRADEGLSIEKVAIQFGVGKTSVMRWLIDWEPKKTRNKPGTRID